ncbi:MAG: aminotransferase class III-fold pyridoxal phosphate-dependent enzyme [Acidimicrobiales bacterium]
MWDADGNRYVDALAALWFCQAGHGRADIADAVADQLRTLEAFHCFERFTNPVAEELCERLADGPRSTTPAPCSPRRARRRSTRRSRWCG